MFVELFVIGLLSRNGKLTLIFCKFLKQSILWTIEKVPLDVLRRMWIMHDDAPPHFSHISYASCKKSETRRLPGADLYIS